MKKIVLLTFLVLLSSCDNLNKQKKQSDLNIKKESKIEMKQEKRKDTIYNYWALVLDTISDKKEFVISNKKHQLEIKTYSLNDSSIVRNLSQDGESVYLDHSHKMVSDFKLLTDSIFSTKEIDRTSFKKILDPDFYTECNLFSTEMDSIKGNVIYLNSDLAVPDTDNQWRVWYSINIERDGLGELIIKEADYVGL
ncbi:MULTISPECIES: hypothetical protein [unclassified Tenacibaculum]|uniref:hypothetical protein n=1 Tax=unclassified Tenacibaculum TaxID=2635139 RepID=UPI001F17A9AA|nr:MULTISPECIES: hypothetical protein [unclassified Tenacibaculum]MCF2874407.1 hypothetical protein [Tenacibaculum sp. Cn5-1]MCF2934988.1 hypothetical protein [Tenacibaculum sp. Cn5-34]MCG7511198.1 hypothetical protein [Tenacibaculum sp. Cn5-46]